MANDRVMVRCKVCKETVTLWKYYPGGSFLPEITHEKVSEFLDSHLLCALDQEGIDVFTLGQGLHHIDQLLELVTETDISYETEAIRSTNQ